MTRLLVIDVRDEQGIVLARQRSRQVAGLMGFDSQDQVRLATAVSEVARNAVQHGAGGRVEFVADSRALRVVIRDQGPGMADVAATLDGGSNSATGAGLGLVGARRLMDEFVIESVTGRGTTVRLGKHLPRHAPPMTSPALAKIGSELAKPTSEDTLAESRRQNQELLRALGDLREREARLGELNRELEETNRGVVALYAELEEKADSLRRVAELKSRFFSNMSHEFRTPVHSILSLSQLLLDRTDGPLNAEQEKQVAFVRRAALGLSELVNDLLDLAKVEAGKVVVRSEPFRVVDLFATLRGMMRPLLTPDAEVDLVFEDAATIGNLHTDEGKVSQILRNYLSNALKFTERGEVRVAARSGPGETVVFEVCDTGIGIAPEDQELIFEEFGQVDSHIQRRVKGTGLGLPLSKRLAELLGGQVSVRSAVGAGSTFYLVIPRVYSGPTARPSDAEPARLLDPARQPILVIDDDPTAPLLYDNYLGSAGLQVFTARTCEQAREFLRFVTPAAIMLDVLVDTGHGWDLLVELKSAPSTRMVPVVVVTVADADKRATDLGADAWTRKPVERSWLVRELKRLIDRSPTSAPIPSVLLIDDDEVSRYLLRGLLSELPVMILEATGGLEGVQRAKETQPRAIFLDLVMPDLSGFEVLEQLKADPVTRHISVIVYTSQMLDETERDRLRAGAASIISKGGEGSREETALAIRRALVKAVGLGVDADE